MNYFFNIVIACILVGTFVVFIKTALDAGAGEKQFGIQVANCEKHGGVPVILERQLLCLNKSLFVETK